ncbi:MAG: hypothetical protein NTX88_06240 [Candidatus Atribacteria bacterium]|nr:hypothetical protein [Candidatus Atribacteria bacterium]
MKKFSFFLILLFWILVVLWHIPGLALAQNTDNLLNLPPLNQGTPAPNQNTGQLPIIDFSQPQPTNPPVSNQQSTLPTPQPLLNNQNQVQILSPNPTPNSNPNQPLPSVWKKYNVRELIGVGDQVGGGMVEYPDPKVCPISGF